MGIQGYKDLNLNLLKKSNEQILSNEQVINQSLYNLFNTTKGSRFFNRDFGSGLKQLIGEPLNGTLISEARLIILDDISRYEPRISIESASNISVIPDPDNYSLFIKINYVIVENGQVGNFYSEIKLN